MNQDHFTETEISCDRGLLPLNLPASLGKHFLP